MATYIQGVTDYIPQLQPFRPDYNFLGNILQTKQTKYDAAKRKVSDLYGSLLNGPLSRDGNIQRRDAFFKAIDNDLKKISGLDLSLEQNVDQAESVFKGFIEDDYMMRDMAWTKNFMNQVDKHEQLKNCTDPKKCGDVKAWEIGLNELYYKRDEFKNVSDDESLKFANAEYNGYYDWEPLALKAAKDANLKVERDTVTGQWIVHEEGGALVQGGLTTLFNSLYGNDPRVQSNNESIAYVNRKNAAKAGVMQYGSEEEAEKHHIMTNINEGLKSLNTDLKTVSEGYNQVTSTINEYKQKKDKQGLSPKEQAAYDLAIKQKEYLDKAQTSLKGNIDDIQNNIDKNDINSLRRRSDLGAASKYKASQIQNMASALAGPGSRTVKVNPYGEIAANTASQKAIASHKAGLDLQLMEAEYGYKYKLEELKYALENGTIPSEDDTEMQEVEGAPWGNVDLDAVDNPKVGYERNNTLMTDKFKEAQGASTGMLFNLFTAAKTAYNTNKSAGALQYLQKFGKDWNNIKSMSDFNQAMTANKQISTTLFSSVLAQASTSKNPTGNYGWAQPILQKNAAQIDAVKVANEAFHAVLNFNNNVNKKIALKLTSPEDKMLITPNGVMVPEAAYIQKYKTMHTSASTSEARNMYERSKNKFFEFYNTSKEVSIDQGVGLAGTGMVTGSPLKMVTLDSGKKTTVLKDVINTTSQALNSKGFKVVLGDPTKKNYETDSDAGLASFLGGFINKVKTASIKDKNRLVFNATASPIAGEKEGVSAVTFNAFSPEFINQYTGTKEKPGPLYGKDLSQGVTVFYNKGEVKTPLTAGASPFTTVLKTKNHYKISSYQDNAGTVDFSYDPLTNNVTGIMDYEAYLNGKLTHIRKSYAPFSLENADANHQIILQTLEQIQNANLNAAAEMAAKNRN